VLRYVEDSGVRTTTLRAIGTSVDPNVFGALLLITGVLTIGWLLAAKGATRRWLSFGLLAIVYALLLSLSRGSWIGFTVAGVVLALAGYRRLFLVVPAVLIPAVVLFSGQLARYAEHFLKAVYAQDQATGMRLGEYKDALNLIQQNPWLGVGFGAAPSSDLYLGVSSTYLLVGEEMGLTGLAVYLIAIGTVIAAGVRGVRAAPPSARPIALACLAAFCGVVVSATFDHHYFNLRYQHVSALFWMLAALVVRAPVLGAVDASEPADNQPQ
jgi:polysaccharide biosynthesis protein PslJ